MTPQWINSGINGLLGVGDETSDMIASLRAQAQNLRLSGVPSLVQQAAALDMQADQLTRTPLPPGSNAAQTDAEFFKKPGFLQGLWAKIKSASTGAKVVGVAVAAGLGYAYSKRR